MADFDFVPLAEDETEWTDVPVETEEDDDGFSFTPEKEPEDIDFSAAKPHQIFSVDGSNTNAPKRLGAAAKSFYKNKKLHNAAVFGESISQSVVRGLLDTAGGIGSFINWYGDNMILPDGFLGMEKKTIDRLNTFGRGWQKAGETLRKGADFVLKDEGLKLDEDTFKGDFLDNPSFTRASAAIASAAPSLMSMAGIVKLTGSAGLAYFIMGGVDSADIYEASKEAGQDLDKTNILYGSAMAGTALIDKLLMPVERILGKKLTGKSIGKKIADRIVGGSLEAIGEGSQTFVQNFVHHFGIDKTKNLFEGVIESAIGGFGSGAFATGAFERASDALKETGATQEEIDAMVDAGAMYVQQHPDEINDIAFQQLNEGLSNFEKFIAEHEGLPEAAEARRKKAELEAVGQASFERLVNAGTNENVARAQSRIVQGIALWGSEESGLSPMEYFEQRFPEVRREKYKEFRDNIAKAKAGNVDLFELLVNPREYRRLEKAERGRKGASLLSFLRKNGGLKDDGGDLKAMDAGKLYAGLVNNKTGRSIDDMALEAWEAGYFPEFNERPAVDDLIEAVRDELSGNKRYAFHSENEKSFVAEADALAEQMDELGIDYSNMSAREAEKAYNDAVAAYNENTAAVPQETFDDVPFQTDEETKADINSPEFKEWSHNAPFYEANKAEDHNFKTGEPLVAEVFHGTQRSDRVGSMFLPSRATSGPMAFSTDTRSIAEGYASNKVDTSIYNETEGDFYKYYTVKIPNHDPVTLDRLWNILPYAKKKEVREKAPHITLDDNGENVVYDEKETRGNGGYYIEGNQNPINALVESWPNAGYFFDEMEKFQKVLELAGLGEYDIKYIDPNAVYPKVYELYVEMQNPLVTHDIPKKVMTALKRESKKQSRDVAEYGADAWDKNTQDPIEWIENLESDKAYVWTSIPDWVTNTLKKMGYDGIVDKGGKGGGYGHNVFIPFESHQYKSVYNTGTFDAENPNIYYQSSAPRGAYYDRVIRLFERANASTFMHETAHWFKTELQSFNSEKSRAMLEKVERWENEEFARRYKTELKDSRYIVRDTFGNVAYDMNFQTEEQARDYAKNELFARGFEAYLKEGKSPNNYMKQAFKAFWNWLRHLYRSAKSLNVGLNDDIRSVYSDIIGGEDIDFYLDGPATDVIAARQKLQKEKETELDSMIERAVEEGKGKNFLAGYFAEKTEAAKDRTRWWEKAVVPISTRAYRVNPRLKNRLRAYDYTLSQRLNEKMERIRPFLEKWAKFTNDDDIAFDLAVKNQYDARRDMILEKYDAVEEFKAVQSLLQSIYDEAASVKVDMGYKADYFPRQVADVDGLLSFLHGEEMASELRRAEIEAGFSDMTPEEQADFLNKFLRGFNRKDTTAPLPGNVKKRTIVEVTPEINKFYKPSMQALTNYVERMNASIESRKFWGFDMDNIEDSIGAFVDELIQNGEIKPEQDREVEEILRARFKAKGVSNKFLLWQKNASYVYTMGGVNSAITQLDDISVALYKAGFWNTVHSVLNPNRPGLSREELGLQKIGQEFMESTTMSKAVDWVFKKTGLDAIDGFGKNVLINATFDKFQKMAVEDEAALRERIEPIMEEQTDSTIEDIKEGKISDNVKLLMFNELADMQPIALSEMPEYYLTSGNGRVLYMLKTFMLKRIDIFRNECFDKIRAGQTKEGIQNLFRLASLMILCGVSKDAIIDMMFGRRIILNDTIVNNVLGLFGVTKYQLYKARDEGFEGFAASFIPPLFSMWTDIGRDISKNLFSDKGKDLMDFEVFKGVPLVGRFFYWWFGGGRTKENNKKNKGKRGLK